MCDTPCIPNQHGPHMVRTWFARGWGVTPQTAAARGDIASLIRSNLKSTLFPALSFLRQAFLRAAPSPPSAQPLRAALVI